LVVEQIGGIYEIYSFFNGSGLVFFGNFVRRLQPSNRVSPLSDRNCTSALFEIIGKEVAEEKLTVSG